jgi:hypothetical protein
MEKLKLVGRRFGRWQVVAATGSSKHGHTLWLCRCDCGVERVVNRKGLTSGDSKSCGCLRKLSTTHGQCSGRSKSAEYAAYANAKQRCTNPNNPRWHDYGGRGIEFKFACFEEFLAEVGFKPSPGFMIDRIYNDGHYDFGNVQWISAGDSAANRRALKLPLKIPPGSTMMHSPSVAEKARAN